MLIEDGLFDTEIREDTTCPAIVLRHEHAGHGSGGDLGQTGSIENKIHFLMGK
jgi:hypothetical protein